LVLEVRQGDELAVWQALQEVFWGRQKERRNIVLVRILPVEIGV
jgi:hypothetical protein